MLQELAARLTKRFTPGVYNGSLAMLIPIDVALSFLAKRNYSAYRVWHRYSEMTNGWFTPRAPDPVETADLLQQLRTQGFGLQHDAFPRAEVDEARAFVLDLYERAKLKLPAELKTNDIVQYVENDIRHEFHVRTGHFRFYFDDRRIDRLPPLMSRFFDEPNLRALACSYFGTTRVKSRQPYVMAEVLTQAQHPETWHIDCVRPTLKTFLYLSDVTLRQGPLRVIPATHQPNDEVHEIRFRICRGGPSAAYFDEQEDAKLDPRGVPLPAGGNTVTVFDTRMLHAGSRCIDGIRVVLVNGYRPLVASRLTPRNFRDPAPALPPWQRVAARHDR